MADYIRGGRAMKQNHSNAIPRRVAAISIATELDKRDPSSKAITCKFSVGAMQTYKIIDGKRTAWNDFVIFHPDDFWRHIKFFSRSRETTYIVGHNVLRDFRALKLPDRFIAGELSLDWPRTRRNKMNERNPEQQPYGLAVIQSPPTIIACRILETQSRIVFVDIRNYFDATLPELDELAWQSDDSYAHRLKDCSIARQRCEVSSKILAIVFGKLTEFVRTQQCGMFRYTVASQAKAMFRHVGMEQKIYPHCEDDVKAIERKAYIGGRTEVFKRGKISDTVYKLDVSSFYPSLMERNKFPWCLHSFELRNDYGEIPIHHSLLPYIAECELYSESGIYPVRTPKVILYPKGTIYTTLAGPELQSAKERGELKRIRSWACYQIAPLFKVFVDRCWTLRREYEAYGNRIFADYIKRLSNSLYGKFAELSPRWTVCQNVDVAVPWSTWAEIDYIHNKVNVYRAFGWIAERDDGRGEKTGTFPAISAFVTSYGRLHMNLLRGICKPREVIYQGIDSLIVTKAGYDSLNDMGYVSDRELGKLRIEMVTNNGELRGPADYTLGGRDVIAGKPGMDWFNEAVELNHQRYIAKEGLFTPIGCKQLELCLRKWHRQVGTAKGNYDTEGYWHPFDTAQLTSTSDVSGSSAVSNNSALA